MKTLQTLACAALLTAAAVGGATAADFRSFGVIDFTDFGTPYVTGVTNVDPGLTLTFGDQPFSATNPGAFNVYLSESGAALSTLKYQPSDQTATAGVGSQLGALGSSLFFLGSGQYTSTSGTVPGSVLSYNLTLPTGAAENYFTQQFAAGNNIRLVVTADPSTPNEVASLAGAGGGTGGVFNAPQLTLSGETTGGGTFAGSLDAAPPNTPGDSGGDTAQVGITGPGSSQTYMDIEGIGNVTPAASAVPEANTPALLLAGLLGLSVVGIARRRRAA